MYCDDCGDIVEYSEKLINALETIISLKDKEILFLKQDEELKESQKTVVSLCNELRAANDTVEAYLVQIEALRGELTAFKEPELLDSDMPVSKEEYRNLMLAKTKVNDVKTD